MEEKNYKNEKSDPVIDFGHYSFDQNKSVIKPQGFSASLFWSQLNMRDKLYTTFGMIIFIILTVIFVSYFGTRDNAKTPVTPMQYLAPVNYPFTIEGKYTPPLP